MPIEPTPSQIKYANRAQINDRMMQKVNFDWPEILPCFVCGEPHPTYFCCERCDYDTHLCQGCGEVLGHQRMCAHCILENIKYPTPVNLRKRY